MKKTRTLTARLRRGKKFFCSGMTCRKNIGRDVVVIILSIAIAGTLLGLACGKKEKKEISEKPIGQVAGVFFEEGKNVFNSAPLEKMAPEELPAPTEENSDVTNISESEKSMTEKVLPVTVTPKSETPKVVTPKATETGCIKIPAKILAGLKGAPVPPDGKKKDGKLICHVLAEGKKDKPQKSKKNPKGQWGGCCYDPDELPNPNCCYPVGSVYEKPLLAYFNNPFPHRK
ncbi:MAG: hypothetical protein WA064_00705 [Candidatus Moraniibacteriota bacterium]